MNLTSNEWLEISTSKTAFDMLESFGFRSSKFLYPRNGESFCLRLIGPLSPHYRSYINPNGRWNEFLTGGQINGEFESSLLDQFENFILKVPTSCRSSKYFYSLVTCHSKSFHKSNSLRFSSVTSGKTFPTSFKCLSLSSMKMVFPEGMNPIALFPFLYCTDRI